MLTQGGAEYTSSSKRLHNQTGTHMALGPKNFNLTVSLDKVFVYQGDDIDGISAGPASEPYLWVFMVKIDGEGLYQQDNYLVGYPNYFFSSGNQGNLGGSIQTGTRYIPPHIGSWTTSMKPIPISVLGQQLTEIPGTIIVAAVL